MAQPGGSISIADVQKAHQDLLLAERARVTGNLDQAQRQCEDLLERYPDYFGAQSTLGMIHVQNGKFTAALPHLFKAMLLNPMDWMNLTNLGRVYFETEATELAVRTLNQALALAPKQKVTLYYLARTLIALQRHKDAIVHLELAQEQDETDPLIPTRLMECYLHQKRYKDAAAALKQALDLGPDPNTTAYLCRLATTLSNNVDIDFDILETVDAVADAHRADDTDGTAHIAFARAACLERLGRHEEAWKCLVSANAPLAQRYEEQSKTFSDQADDLLSRCLNWRPVKKDGAGQAEDYPLLLFILGTSRAGKTTVESLVEKLPGVKILQEHDLTSSTARHVSQSSDLPTTHHLCKLPRALDSLIEETFRTRLLKSSESADIVTITHPGPIADAGRLVDSAPNVKFIFVKRNEDDVAFRIFGQLYQGNTNEYAYDLKAIYRYIANHHRMIDNWLEKLGKRAVLINYEEMVEDPQSTLKHVARFCGLKPPSSTRGLDIGDDRGCAAPYLQWMHAEKVR